MVLEATVGSIELVVLEMIVEGVKLGLLGGAIVSVELMGLEVSGREVELVVLGIVDRRGEFTVTGDPIETIELVILEAVADGIELVELEGGYHTGNRKVRSTATTSVLVIA